MELNFVTGKWSTLKINSSDSSKYLFSITSLTVPQHLTCYGTLLSIHSLQFHLPHSSLMPHKTDINESDIWRLNILFIVIYCWSFLKYQWINSYFSYKSPANVSWLEQTFLHPNNLADRGWGERNREDGGTTRHNYYCINIYQKDDSVYINLCKKQDKNIENKISTQKTIYPIIPLTFRCNNDYFGWDYFF